MFKKNWLKIGEEFVNSFGLSFVVLNRLVDNQKANH